jgi:hypothetical protein
MKYKLLNLLPINDKSELNFEVANEVISLLSNTVYTLFTHGADANKQEELRFESQFLECDGYNTLLFLLSVYENSSLRVGIAAVLGNFYAYAVIPENGRIIVDIMGNFLKEHSLKRINKDDDNELMVNVLGSLIRISFNDENNNILLNSGIVSTLFYFVNYEDVFVILCNICSTRFIECRNRMISNGIFDVFYWKLLEISPPPPQKMIPGNYQCISCIVDGINHLLKTNLINIIFFLKTKLIPLLLLTLNSAISIEDGTSNKIIGEIQYFICSCFVECSYYSSEVMYFLFENKIIDSMMNIIEMYLNQIKNKRLTLRENVVEKAIRIIFNITKDGSETVKKYFNENSRFNKLIDLFEFFVSQPQSPIKKSITIRISLSICRLLRREKPPSFCNCVIEYVYNLKSFPSSIFNHDFPLDARCAWDNMIDADECLLI